MKLKLGMEPQERAIARIFELKMNYWVDAMRADLAKIPQDEANRICEHVMAWADAEIRERASITIAAKINAAKFIKIQTVDQFDFDFCISTRKLKKSYLELHEKAKSGELSRAIFIGQAGLGKTHLARALGYAACQAKTNVLFSTAAKITNKLATAKSIHTLESEINKFKRPRILIIDELGYVNMDTEASNLFFQLISARHDQGLGTIVTSNIRFAEWNQIFANDRISQVIIERLIEGASIFHLEGVSYRAPGLKPKK